MAIKRSESNVYDYHAQMYMWRFVPAQNRLAVVVTDVRYHTASGNSFKRVGHSRVVRTLGTIVVGGVALRLWNPRAKLGCSTCRNSLISNIYPVARARKHVLMFPTYKIWYPSKARWQTFWPLLVSSLQRFWKIAIITNLLLEGIYFFYIYAYIKS